jgi:hypothetical protein
LKTIPFTSVLAVRKTEVRLLVEKNAVSDDPFGTVDGFQLLAVFQSAESGLVFHVALPAWLVCPLSNKTDATRNPPMNGALNKRGTTLGLHVVDRSFMGLFFR